MVDIQSMGSRATDAGARRRLAAAGGGSGRGKPRMISKYGVRTLAAIGLVCALALLPREGEAGDRVDFRLRVNPLGTATYSMKEALVSMRTIKREGANGLEFKFTVSDVRKNGDVYTGDLFASMGLRFFGTCHESGSGLPFAVKNGRGRAIFTGTDFGVPEGIGPVELCGVGARIQASDASGSSSIGYFDLLAGPPGLILSGSFVRDPSFLNPITELAKGKFVVKKVKQNGVEDIVATTTISGAKEVGVPSEAQVAVFFPSGSSSGFGFPSCNQSFSFWQVVVLDRGRGKSVGVDFDNSATSQSLCNLIQLKVAIGGVFKNVAGLGVRQGDDAD
jgi:hypothetical protein